MRRVAVPPFLCSRYKLKQGSQRGSHRKILIVRNRWRDERFRFGAPAALRHLLFVTLQRVISTPVFFSVKNHDSQDQPDKNEKVSPRPDPCSEVARLGGWFNTAVCWIHSLFSAGAVHVVVWTGQPGHPHALKHRVRDNAQRTEWRWNWFTGSRCASAPVCTALSWDSPQLPWFWPITCCSGCRRMRRADRTRTRTRGAEFFLPKTRHAAGCISARLLALRQNE
jgi:hypothetical protein